jgi:hypothetical protein
MYTHIHFMLYTDKCICRIIICKKLMSALIQNILWKPESFDCSKKFGQFFPPD